jgi:hypothetical protein
VSYDVDGHVRELYKELLPTERRERGPPRLREVVQDVFIEHEQDDDGDAAVVPVPCTAQYTSHHITSHHITSHHITSHHITSHHITSHHITSHHITSQRTRTHGGRPLATCRTTITTTTTTTATQPRSVPTMHEQQAFQEAELCDGEVCGLGGLGTL